MQEIANKHKNSYIVKVQRRIPYFQNAQNLEMAEGYFSLASRSIGGYYKKDEGTRAGKGLDPATVEILLPQILGVYVSDPSFIKEVEQFYINIIHNVQPEGLELEIGMSIDNEKPITEYDEKSKTHKVFQYPINPYQYVCYMHIIGHPMVARSKEEANKRPSDMCKYYIEDELIERNAKIKELKIKDKAASIYEKYKKDYEIQKQILVNLGIDAFRYDTTKLQLTFRKQIESDQIRKIEQFVAVAEDDLLIKLFTVRAFLALGVLKTEGIKILDSENNRYLGDSIREVALELYKAENADYLSLLKARQIIN